MLSKLITRLRPGVAADAAAAAPSGVDAMQLGMVLAHFPIGTRLTYFPEYRREFKFDTLILGYRINDHDLYAQERIELTGDAVPHAFHVDNRTVVPASALTRFAFLLPDTSHHQKKLDIVTRSELGRDGQFRQGTTITLQARSVGRGVPTLDTQVARKETLAAGPFAGQACVVVEPELGSIKVVDKRRKPRVAVAIEALLLPGDDGPRAVAHPCEMVDFADDTLRLQPAAGSKLPVLRGNAVVAVQFTAGPGPETFRVRGTVLRSGEQATVVRFGEVFVPAAGSYRKIDTFDVLEIKTGLLNARR